MMHRRICQIIIAVFLTLLIVPAAFAQDPTAQILEQEIDSKFRDEITARLTAEHNVEITEVEFFYRLVGQRATARNVAEFDPGTTVEASISIDQERPETYFPPGTELEYWWKLTDAEGNSTKTEQETFLYLDNRYDFKQLNSERLTLYWYNGGRAFGDALFNRANQALNQLEADVGASIERPIKIFIYGNHDDLIGALSTSSQEWTGGVAYSDEGVVVIGVRADNLDWGLKAMTHEITHLVIHQATDNPYSDLPRWLDEGLAVYNENPEWLDEQFDERFQDAVRSNSLMTLQTLANTFPADPEAANLAYGQSGAIVHFIIRNYGPEKMAELLDIFSEGALVENALEEALGEDVKSLDNAFRARWDLPPLPGTEPAQAETQADTDTSQSDTNQADADTSDADQSEAPSEPADSASADGSSSERSGGLNLPCIGGLLPLAALGAVMMQRRRKWWQ